MANCWSNHVLMTEHEAINQICAPLKGIGIDGFFFMRLFPNGTFIDLATDLYWSDYFLSKYYAQEYCFKTVRRHMSLEKHIDLWSLHDENEFFKDAKQYFNVKEGVSITLEQTAWKDVFCYYIKNCNSRNLEDLINLLELLHKFSDYFIDKAGDILLLGEKSPLIIPQAYRNTLSESQKPIDHSVKKLLEIMSVHHEIYSPGFRQLSRQEIKCIQQSTHGLSSKEIANKLQISKRTVEAYLLSARNKTNCRNIVELISQYQVHRYL